MLSVIAKLPVKAEKREEAVAAIKQLMLDVAKEEGTRLYTLNVSQSEPNTLVFLERYVDQDAMNTHSSTPYFKAFFKKSAEFLEGKPEIILMEELASI